MVYRQTGIRTRSSMAKLGTRFDCMVWITTEHNIDAAHNSRSWRANWAYPFKVKTPACWYNHKRCCLHHRTLLSPDNVTLFSGGTMGAEAFFGEVAASVGIREVISPLTDTNKKEPLAKHCSMTKNWLLDRPHCPMSATCSTGTGNAPKICKRSFKYFGTLSLTWSSFCGRHHPTRWYGHGGTGWSVELAKRWYKPIWVFDQSQSAWFTWNGQTWEPSLPTITSRNIAGSGTRFLNHEGKEAIRDCLALFSIIKRHTQFHQWVHA